MIPTHTFPTLETDRLFLRPLAQGDLAFVFQHFSDPAVYRYLLDEAPVTTLEEAQAIIDFYQPPTGKPYNRWLMMHKAEARPIGTCGFHKWQAQHRRAEIGYDLEPRSWHQGLMREALHAAIGYGFAQMRLHRIEAMVAPANTASLRLLERLGFQREGVLRQNTFQGGAFHDHLLLALLQPEWRVTERGV